MKQKTKNFKRKDNRVLKTAVSLLKSTGVGFLALFLMISQVPLFGAFEAHVIDVTATVSTDANYQQAEINVVLNEFVPNPVGNDNQDGIDGEWVEIYNNGGTSVDVDGWIIEDASNNTRTISSANTFGSSTIIGANNS